MDFKKSYDLLNAELSKLKIKRTITICGGAALISSGYSSRATEDIDVLNETIDPELQKASDIVGNQLGLIKGWLNNNPKSLSKELPVDWEERCEIAYLGSHLTVHRIGRRDLLFSKIYAACDRSVDIPDIIAMKPTEAELLEAKAWVLKRDAYEKWPQIVEECLSEIRRGLHG